MGRVLIGLAILGTIILIVCLVWATMAWYNFKMGCKDYLKLAGDAPTIERAHEFLSGAVRYMEEHGLITGNSALVFHTPRADLGIWYKQTKGALDTLSDIIKRQENGTSLAQLERDNALMKIREVVLDNGSDGTEVTLPPNISLFPHQVFFWFLFVASLLFQFCWFGFAMED